MRWLGTGITEKKGNNHLGDKNRSTPSIHFVSIFVSFGPQSPQLLGVREILPEADRQTGLRVQGLSDQMPQGVSRQGVGRVHKLENS